MTQNIVQVFNPRGWWVKVNTAEGTIIGHKKTPYKNIKIVETKHESMLVSTDGECNTCRGTGYIWINYDRLENDPLWEEKTVCPTCHGFGGCKA